MFNPLLRVVARRSFQKSAVFLPFFLSSRTTSIMSFFLAPLTTSLMLAPRIPLTRCLRGNSGSLAPKLAASKVTKPPAPSSRGLRASSTGPPPQSSLHLHLLCLHAPHLLIPLPAPLALLLALLRQHREVLFHCFQLRLLCPSG